MTKKIFNKYTVRESEMYGINKKIKTVWEKKKFVRWKFNYIYHWKRSLSKILTSKNKLRGGDLEESAINVPLPKWELILRIMRIKFEFHGKSRKVW